jgi:hypothetical protein
MIEKAENQAQIPGNGRIWRSSGRTQREKQEKQESRQKNVMAQNRKEKTFRKRMNRCQKDHI